MVKVTGCFQKEPHTVHTIMNPYVNIFVFYIFLNIVQCKNSTSSPRQPYCGLPFHWESWSLPWIYTTCFHTSYIFSGKVFFEEYFFYYNKLTELHLPKNALVKCCWRSEICKILTDGRMPVKKWIKYISLSSRLKWAKMLAQYIIMYPIKAYKISSCITC